MTEANKSRYEELVEESYKLLQKYEAEENSAAWVEFGEEQGCKIHQRAIEGSSTYLWRGKVFIKGATVQDWRDEQMTHATDRNKLLKMDPDNRAFEILHKFDGINFTIARSRYTANSWTVSDRDFLFVRVYRPHWDNPNDVVFFGQSIDEEKFAGDPIVENNKAKDTVRGTLHFFAWVAKEVEGGLSLKYYTHANPNGWLPTPVYNAVSKTQALGPLKYKVLLEK